MLRLILISLLVTSIGESSAQRRRESRDGLVQGTALAREAEYYLEDARAMLRDYSRDEPDNRILGRMAQKAVEAEIWDATGDELCEGADMVTGGRSYPGMRAEPNGKKIYVCPGFTGAPCVYNGASRTCGQTPPAKLYMILHEIGHLTGLGGSLEDECLADVRARLVLEEFRIQIVPGYYDQACFRRNR
jgi:hypothetical protein